MHNNLTILISLLPETTVNPFNILDFFSGLYIVSLRYLEKELFVDSTQTEETEFPVVLMDWVKGITLDKYLREINSGIY